MSFWTLNVCRKHPLYADLCHPYSAQSIIECPVHSSAVPSLLSVVLPPSSYCPCYSACSRHPYWGLQRIGCLLKVTQLVSWGPCFTWHCSHLGLIGSLLPETVLCLVGCLLISLASTSKWQEEHILWPLVLTTWTASRHFQKFLLRIADYSNQLLFSYQYQFGSRPEPKFLATVCPAPFKTFQPCIQFLGIQK